MRETDTFHCFWAAKENTKIERKPNSASYVSFSRFFYSYVTSAVSVEIRFLLVSKPSEDNTKPAVCSKGLLCQSLCRIFSFEILELQNCHVPLQRWLVCLLDHWVTLVGASLAAGLFVGLLLPSLCPWDHPICSARLLMLTFLVSA